MNTMEEIKVDTVSFEQTDSYKKIKWLYDKWDQINQMTKQELLDNYYLLEENISDIPVLELKGTTTMMNKYKALLKIRFNQDV